MLIVEFSYILLNLYIITYYTIYRKCLSTYTYFSTGCIDNIAVFFNKMILSFIRGQYQSEKTVEYEKLEIEIQT